MWATAPKMKGEHQMPGSHIRDLLNVMEHGAVISLQKFPLQFTPMDDHMIKNISFWDTAPWYAKYLNILAPSFYISSASSQKGLTMNTSNV